MSPLALLAADLAAIGVLTFGVHFPRQRQRQRQRHRHRHRRRDLVVAYLGVNVGVLAVSAALSSSGVGAGPGLGLFGVLSIIRLRPTELDQHEVAYYFAALALGLLGGPGDGAPVLTAALVALVVAVLWAAGHPRLVRRYHQQLIVLDVAVTDEPTLTGHLEALLGARAHQVTVQRVDLVDDTTWVDVRFEQVPERASAAVAAEAAPASAVLRPAPVRP
ncbi:DUF4956 domain-containing protein [Geodermatophilus maliterrae]|uniref:DUF4956 domain-containing protein n=1 Tax=Geodermatophilus maliterrae TaxID=3162531 RepID=A0ABV3XJZ9_9ACTN